MTGYTFDVPCLSISFFQLLQELGRSMFDAIEKLNLKLFETYRENMGTNLTSRVLLPKRCTIFASNAKCLPKHCTKNECKIMVTNKMIQ
mmetsp:Transcript_33889/g.71296  ORF Transcript_33889/g.71296 Transcript_33889/m.71296 type:complete len:89 (+) Transcript_33889:3321-3587(+)